MLERVVIGVELNLRLGHHLAGLDVGQIQSCVRFKVDGRGDVVRPEAPLHRRLEDGNDRLLFLELDFDFGRVDVHVHLRGIHGQMKHVQRMLPFGKKAVVGTHNRSMQQAMLHEPAVDHQELLAPGLPRGIGLADKAINGHDVGRLLHGHQAFVVLGTEDAHDALTGSPRLQPKQGAALVRQRKLDGWMREGHTLKFIHHVAQFHRIRLQEIPPGWHVEEQVLDVKRRAHRRRLHPFLHGFVSTAPDHRRHLVPCHLRGQFHVGNRRDGGQGFPPEPFGRQGKQIFGTGQLGSRVALEARLRIRRRHPTAVVDDLDRRSPCIQDMHLDARGTCVHGVFHEFLHHRRGALDDLACGNLVGHVFRQPLDPLRHPCDCMKSKNVP